MAPSDAISLGINLEQYISKRNERERSRVRNVNDAFDNLKNSLPLEVEKLTKRMSKVEILRTAISYIRDLEGCLDGQEQHLGPASTNSTPTPGVAMEVGVGVGGFGSSTSSSISSSSSTCSSSSSSSSTSSSCSSRNNIIATPTPSLAASYQHQIEAIAQTSPLLPQMQMTHRQHQQRLHHQHQHQHQHLHQHHQHHHTPHRLHDRCHKSTGADRSAYSTPSPPTIAAPPMCHQRQQQQPQPQHCYSHLSLATNMDCDAGAYYLPAHRCQPHLTGLGQSSGDAPFAFGAIQGAENFNHTHDRMTTTTTTTTTTAPALNQTVCNCANINPDMMTRNILVNISRTNQQGRQQQQHLQQQVAAMNVDIQGSPRDKYDAGCDNGASYIQQGYQFGNNPYESY